MRRGLLVGGAIGLFLIQAVQPSRAQDACRGDLTGDGRVNEDDVAAFAGVLFGDAETDGSNVAQADVNGDAAVTAADIISVTTLQGAGCPPTLTPTIPLPTRTPTPVTPPSATQTPTATRTPTRTFTSRPTPTPTQICVLQPAPLGTTNGELTTSDCLRAFESGVRYTDDYSITAAPGTALTVNVVATGPLAPFIEIRDPSGQFGFLAAVPPLTFTVTTSQAYELLVTSAASSGTQLGSYQLTVTSVTCPTPVPLNVNTTVSGTLDGTECPDPASPPDPADLYTFTVPQVPVMLTIKMRQRDVDSTLDPTLTLIGPDDFAVAIDEDSGGGLNDLDAQMRFLALQAGTYTLIATGGRGTGRYTLSLNASTCPATALPSPIPEDRPLLCRGSSGGCMGTLSGDPGVTTCVAPAPISDSFLDVPELGSPADLYTFTAAAGDVISVEMDAGDDAHLYLLGPASAGNPLVAEDDDSAPSGMGNAQLAATLVLPGTYTIIAANNNVLAPPEPGFPADTVDYTLFIQQCPFRATLDPSTGQNLSTESFTASDCFGFGGIPFANYSFPGTAGQFVTATVTANANSFDPFVRLFGPDGSKVENDNDVFSSTGTTARVSRILPVDGTYYVEVSSTPGVAVNVNASPPPVFAVQAQSCPTTAASSGAINGTFGTGDCDLGGGRKFDVYTFSGPADPAAVPAIATMLAPTNACVVGLSAEGPQVPAAGPCAPRQAELPVISGGTYGFIIAATDTITRGYTTAFSLCPAAQVGYGAILTPVLTSGDCRAADGAPSDGFVFSAPADLVRFSEGASGGISGTFPLRAVLTDLTASAAVSDLFFEDPESLLPFGGNLAFLLRVTGATPADHGNYTLTIDSALRRP